MIARYAGKLGTDVYTVPADEVRIAHIQLSATEAVAADVDGVHAAITGSASAVTAVTTNITDPPYPRNLTVTPGGTTADVAACSVTITGTNINGDVISEDFAFLANASTATTGAKAFKTVTSISIPQQDGAAATFTIGFGDKLGLPYMFDEKPIGFASDDGVIESTAPTWTFDADEIEKNTVDLNSAMDGSVIDIYMFV